MVDRTGLHVAPVPGSNPIGTAPVDGRLVQAALFGSTGQCLSGGGVTPSSSTMAFTVAAGVYQIPDTANGGAVYHSPIDSATVTPAAGQSGGRIDSLYVLQQDWEKNGSTSRVVYGIAAGTPGSGVAPSFSGISGGPMRLANITVPASATKATDCTVNWVVPPAALMADGPVAANRQLLDLITGAYIGQLALVTGAVYGGQTFPMVHRWNGTGWRPYDCDLQNFTPSQAGATSAGGGTLQALFRLAAGEAVIEYTAAIANTANARVEVGSLPFARGAGGRAMPKGRAYLITPAGQRYPLSVDFNADDTNSNTLIVRTLAAPEVDTNGQSVPVNWSGCTFKMSFAYTPYLI